MRITLFLILCYLFPPVHVALSQDSRIVWDKLSLVSKAPELAEFVTGTITGINNTKASIEIIDAKPSCGCMILPDSVHATITPEGKVSIPFRINITPGISGLLRRDLVLSTKSNGVNGTEVLPLEVRVPEVVHFSETRFKIHPGQLQYKLDLEIKGNHALKNIEVDCGMGKPITGAVTRLSDQQAQITFSVADNINQGALIGCSVRVVFDDWKNLQTSVVFDR